MGGLPVPCGGDGPEKLPAHGFTYTVGFGDGTALLLAFTTAEVDKDMLDEALLDDALLDVDDNGVVEALFVELALLLMLLELLLLLLELLLLLLELLPMLLVEFWMLTLSEELELGLELLELTVAVSSGSLCRVSN